MATARQGNRILADPNPAISGAYSFSIFTSSTGVDHFCEEAIYYAADNSQCYRLEGR